MKIVVLDGYVANSGDLSWDALAALGDLTVYDRTSPSEVVERADGATAILTNKVLITKEVLDNLPALRYIGVLATGVNNVDIEEARRHGVTVCNVPAYSTDSVVQSVFAHLLNITNRTALYSESVEKGEWHNCQDFSYRLTPIIELAGLTIGIYGLGNIGTSVAKVANAFGMNVIALTSKKPWQLPGYIRPVEKEALFAEADVLVLCAPLTAENKHFINAGTLALMKPSAIIINTARGGLVDSAALADALNSGRIYAAGIDVLKSEPPMADEALIGAKNCFVTPHVAWQSDVARRRLLHISAENLKAFINDNPINVVN